MLSLVIGCADGYQAQEPSIPYELRWIEITGGSYPMGREDGEPDERPEHTVEIEDFQLLQSEVTVSQYEACVLEGPCGSVQDLYFVDSDTRSNKNSPLAYVTHTQAREFCAWIDGRLPTESEWEYAARSGGEDHLYPWGGSEPTVAHAIYDVCAGQGLLCDMFGWDVCSKPDGNTEQALCDMAGSVHEWVEDCYHSSYDIGDGAPDDQDPWTDDCEEDFVVRGGSWATGSQELETASRWAASNFHSPFSDVGFRCAAKL